MDKRTSVLGIGMFWGSVLHLARNVPALFYPPPLMIAMAGWAMRAQGQTIPWWALIAMLGGWLGIMVAYLGEHQRSKNVRLVGAAAILVSASALGFYVMAM